MPNPYGAPEISPAELKEMADSGMPFAWLDVREPWEFRKVHVRDERVLLVPLSQIAEQRLDAFPPEALPKGAPIVVQCHHGVRSAQVAAWLRQQGWPEAVSLAGGVAAWADDVDAGIGRY